MGESYDILFLLRKNQGHFRIDFYTSKVEIFKGECSKLLI